MEYRSPVRLVAHAAEPIQPFQPQALHRARKKLLAEMALQDQQLTLDEQLYTRNDVMTLLDGISEEDWKLHTLVYGQEGLLRFLETRSFDPGLLETSKSLQYNGPFVQLLSPYFATAFNEVSGQMLRRGAYGELVGLLEYRSFVLPADEHEAYQRIRIHLSEQAHLLKNLNWENFQQDESVLYFLFDEAWIGFVNGLPASFDTVRDELVRLLLQVVYRFQHKASWYYLFRCCEQISRIRASLDEEVREYLGIMKANAQHEGKTKERSSGPSVGRIIFIAVWVLLMIVRWSNSCNRKDLSVRRVDAPVFSGSESVAVREEMASSSNEYSFKNLLYNLEPSSSDGRPLVIKNGDEPFRSLSQTPVKLGRAYVRVENHTGLNAVMFYFTNSNLLIDSHSRVYAVYLEKGASYELWIQPNFGRLNFAFGGQWMKLRNPPFFRIEKSAGTAEDGVERTIQAEIPVEAYFRMAPGLEQRFLRHDLLLMNFKLGGNKSDPGGPEALYEPFLNSDETPEGRSVLELKRSGDELSVKASGNLYLYESEPRF